MQKLISNNKSNNRTPESQRNKTHFPLFKINVHWSCNACTIKINSQTQKQKCHTIAWIYSSSGFIKINSVT